jgi:uncharacterized protein
MPNLQFDWPKIKQDIKDRGFAVAAGVLSAEECAALDAMGRKGEGFGHTIDMNTWDAADRTDGEYRYFRAPVPEVVAALRSETYKGLRPLANQWGPLIECVEGEPYYEFPETFEDFRSFCNSKGQGKPSCLVLHYRDAAKNSMHQDIYGKVTFPFQAVAMLRQPGEDFEGGRLLMGPGKSPQEATPIELNRGDIAFISTRALPEDTGDDVRLRDVFHGVEPIKGRKADPSGFVRSTLGIIYHGRQGYDPSV